MINRTLVINYMYMFFQQKTLFSNSEILTTSKTNTNSKTIKIVKKQFSLNVQKKIKTFTVIKALERSSI